MQLLKADFGYPVQTIFAIALGVCVLGMFISQIISILGFSAFSMIFVYISIAGSVAVTVISILIMLGEAIDLIRNT